MVSAKQFLQTNGLATWNLTALVDLAAQQGYRFSADELQTAADELWGNLSEEQLSGVIGGGNGRSDTGPVDPTTNPPPGHADRSAGWAPPPGDVSGNSCFFTRGGNR